METARNCISLLRGMTDQKAAEESISLLKKIFLKIASTPEDVKFRRINISNQKFKRYVWSIEPAVQFLKVAGFQQEDGFLSLPPEVDIAPFVAILISPEVSESNSQPTVPQNIPHSPIEVKIEGVKRMTVKVKVGKEDQKIEVFETSTVLQLKEKIHEKLGEKFPVQIQKLILRGKLLQGYELVANIGLTDSSFITMAFDSSKATPVPPDISVNLAISNSPHSAAKKVGSEEEGSVSQAEYLRQHTEFKTLRKILLESPNDVPDFFDALQKNHGQVYMLTTKMLSSCCELMNDPFTCEITESQTRV